MVHIPFHGILLAAMMVAAAAVAGDVATARKELAATGRLRVGVVSAPKANVFFVVQDAGGRPRGVTADLGDELAQTLDVASEFLVFHNSGEVTDALEKGLLDVAFLPVDDERTRRVEFGPAYVLFESTCLVLGSSGFRTVSDLDRPGVRVAGEANTTTIRSAARVLQSATIVAVPSVGEAIDMLRAVGSTRLRWAAKRSSPIKRRSRVRASSTAVFTRPELRSRCRSSGRLRSPT